MGKVAKGRFEARVRELTAGNPMLEAAADPILRSRAVLRSELAGLEKLTRDHAGSDPVCRLMMTMPGVGAVVALTVKSAIDDPGRFRSSKDVGPWVGLTPRREQSGERDIIGQITRAGDVALRTALYRAATVMLNRGRSNWLSTWALRAAITLPKQTSYSTAIFNMPVAKQLFPAFRKSTIEWIRLSICPQTSALRRYLPMCAKQYTGRAWLFGRKTPFQ